MYWNILGAGEIVGRAVKEASSTDRQYYVKDHLGSIRVTVNESGTQDHQSDYYPFGLEMPGRVTTTDAPRERYTGHEIEELGSNTTWYYAGARMYDPLAARWMTVDPLAEKYPGLSPYNYAANAPLYFVDRDGRDITVHYDCDEDGRNCSKWTFTGDNSSDAPDSEYVRQFLEAYDYIVSNVSDTSLEHAARSRDYSFNLRHGVAQFDPRQANDTFKGTVWWDAYRALGVPSGEGVILPPAFGLVHEFSHALSFATDVETHYARRSEANTLFDNNTEKWTILGEETRVARALGLIREDRVTRNCHCGKRIDVSGSTSVEPLIPAQAVRPFWTREY
jgi:RHS repeat-associated protein